MKWNEKKKEYFKNILSFLLFGSLSSREWIPLFGSLSEGNGMEHSLLPISSKPQIRGNQ
jgi:hypothetical protein